MTLTKAIEIQTFMGQPNTNYHTEEIMAARKLGVEALKRCQELHKYTPRNAYMPLPGETKEGK